MARQKDNKTWFVKLIWKDTHCYTLEDALSLYRMESRVNDNVALEEYNCSTGQSRFIRRKGDYFKNI